MLSLPPFSLLANLDRVDDAIDTNAKVAEQIFRVGGKMFPFNTRPGVSRRSLKRAAARTFHVTPSDFERVSHPESVLSLELWDF